MDYLSTLNVGLDVSLDNVLIWKTMQEESGSVSITKAYTNDEISAEFSPGIALSLA
jgi:hypothetical protein